MTLESYNYVYILVSTNADHRYVGITSDLKERLKKHNAGSVPHTAKFRPWKIQTAIAFSDPQRARAFEKYLKSGSGREFARRRL
jgi:putative endonuclease